MTLDRPVRVLISSATPLGDLPVMTIRRFGWEMASCSAVALPRPELPPVIKMVDLYSVMTSWLGDVREMKEQLDLEAFISLSKGRAVLADGLNSNSRDVYCERCDGC